MYCLAYCGLSTLVADDSPEQWCAPRPPGIDPLLIVRRLGRVTILVAAEISAWGKYRTDPLSE